MNSELRAVRARICICVDDFGLSDGVNAAVLALAAQHRVQATSCMVFAPAWASGAAALRQLEPHSIDIGLHLDLTQCPSRPGMHHSLRALILTSALGVLDLDAVRTEIQAQLGEFEQTMGRQPDFIDGHQHVHQLPGIRQVLVAEIQRRYGKAMPWLRISRGLSVHREAKASGLRVALKSAVIKTLGAHGLSELAQRARIARNNRLLGIQGFEANAASYRRQLEAWLAAASDTDLLMCHPSTAAGADDAIGGAREMEYGVLQADALPVMLAAQGVQLLPMSQILHSPQQL